MDILAFKEAFDAFLYKGCLFSLAGLSVVFFMLTCGFRKEIEDFIKKTGPFFVIFFFTWAAWAFISSFPTQEEKEEILKAEKEQEEINKAWGAFFAGGMESDGEGEILSRVEVVEGGEVVECSCSGRKDEDIARGYWLESVATNLMYSYECPSNGVRHLPWYMAGGHTAFKRYDFESAFPLGTNSLEFVTVFQDGRICRTPRDRIPLLKPHDGMFAFVRRVSDFWTLFEPTRRIFTWHNVRDYESSDDVYSMQIEHFANGDFIVRLNEIEKHYRYINPDDWDDDGLANEIDASPKINDGDFFGVASPLPESANPAAYYWVQLCATSIAKVATIRITCDGVSDLGNHVIIARANQVCRVPLLIGAEYTLESSSPVEIVATSSPKVEVYNTFARRNGGRRIRYPLDLWFENVGGNLCELNVSENVGAIVTNLTGGCCMTDINLLGFKWCCSGNCGCSGGEHEVSGIATWEGYSRWVYSWVWCKCISETQAGASAQVSFSNDVIIFENEYTNALHDVVSHSSTTNALRIKVNGGAFGGLLELELNTEGKIGTAGGDVLFSQMEVAAGETIELEHFFKAYNSSEKEGDIIAKARFTEFITGAVIEDEDSMTAVRIAVEPLMIVGKFLNRHCIGVGEQIICRIVPRTMQCDVFYGDRVFKSNKYGEARFKAVCEEKMDAIVFSCGTNNVFQTTLSITEPKEVIAISARELIFEDERTNTAGWAGMVLELVVLPTNVSFSAVHIMEVPEDSPGISPTGYFLNPVFELIWHHTEDRGAGEWYRVQDGNFFLYDHAQCGEALPSGWSEGQITWRIPVAWRFFSEDLDEYVSKEFGVPYYQIFTMTPEGALRVSKLGYWVERFPDGRRLRSNNTKEAVR